MRKEKGRTHFDYQAVGSDIEAPIELNMARHYPTYMSTCNVFHMEKDEAMNLAKHLIKECILYDMKKDKERS